MVKEDILRIAEISKLSFTDKELEKIRALLKVKLEQWSPIKAVKTNNKIVYPTVTIQQLREDIIQPSLPQEKVLSNAPSANDEYVTVPQVLED